MYCEAPSCVNFVASLLSCVYRQLGCCVYFRGREGKSCGNSLQCLVFWGRVVTICASPSPGLFWKNVKKEICGTIIIIIIIIIIPSWKMEAAGSNQTTRRQVPQGRILNCRSIFSSRCMGERRWLFWKDVKKICGTIIIIIIIIIITSWKMEAAGSHQTTRRQVPQGRILNCRVFFPQGVWGSGGIYSSRIAIYLLILVCSLFNSCASGRFVEVDGSVQCLCVVWSERRLEGSDGIFVMYCTRGIE